MSGIYILCLLGGLLCVYVAVVGCVVVVVAFTPTGSVVVAPRRYF